jgi:hypothetical protein
LQVGEILYDDLLYILPFENTVDLVTMKGSGIRNVLEKACYKINPDDVNDYFGSFGYQVTIPNYSVKLFVCPSHVSSGHCPLFVETRDSQNRILVIKDSASCLLKIILIFF